MNDQQDFIGQVNDQHWVHHADEQSINSAQPIGAPVLMSAHEQIDIIGVEMDLLPAREVLTLAAKLARLAPYMRRMKAKNYNNTEIAQWVSERGVEASVSSIAKALAKRAPSNSSKSSTKKL